MKSISDIISEQFASSTSWNIYNQCTGKDIDVDTNGKEKYVIINVGPDNPEVVFSNDLVDFLESNPELSVGESRKFNENGGKGVIYRFK